MFLSDRDIKKAVLAEEIILKPFNEKYLQPASYDVCLGNKFMLTTTHSTTMIDPVKKIFANMHEVIVSDGEEFVLHPGVSILGTSKEFFGSKKYLIQLHGKSSLARIGLLVHNTAGLINPGHFLSITFELCNLNRVPIILRPGMQIGQLTFSELSGRVDADYTQTGRYHNNDWNTYIAPKDSDVPVKKLKSRKVKK